jgi:hypothetical protein
MPRPFSAQQAAVAISRDTAGNPTGLLDSLSGKSLVSGSAVSPDKYTVVLECDPATTPSAAAANAVLFQAALDTLDSTGGRIHFKGGGHFRTGFKTSSRIVLSGETENAPITFWPDVADTTFFMWQRRRYNSSGVQISNPSSNSELSIEACGALYLTVLGNRATKGNCFLMRGMDHGYMQNVQVRGIKGYSFNMQHVREYSIDSYITRFNGYCDPANPANNVADVIMAGDAYPGFEAGNLSSFNNVQITFTFGPGLQVDAAFKNSFSGFLIHSLAPVNTSLEGIIIKYFGGSAGYDASANPLNELAAMSVGTANATSVSGMKMTRGFAACQPIEVRNGARSMSFDNGWIVGNSGPALVTADGANTAITFGQVDATSCNPAIMSVTCDSTTDIFTVTSVDGGQCAYLPETGATVTIATVTSSPMPFVTGARGYLIRLSDTTFKIAKTRALALAGTAVDITTNGAGIQVHIGGELFFARNGAEICMSGQGQFDQGRVVADSDELSIITRKRMTTTVFNSGPCIPSDLSEQKLFVAKNIDLNSAHTDTVFQKVFQGNRYCVTRYAVVRTSGGATTNNATISVFLGAGETVGTLLTNLRLYQLSAQNQVIFCEPPNPTVSLTITGGNATTNATASLVYDPFTGYVSGVTVLTGGAGYTAQPTFTVAGINGLSMTATIVSNAITAITLSGTAGITNGAGGTGFIRSSTSNTTLYAVPQQAAGSAMYADMIIYGRVID